MITNHANQTIRSMQNKDETEKEIQVRRVQESNHEQCNEQQRQYTYNGTCKFVHCTFEIIAKYFYAFNMPLESFVAAHSIAIILEPAHTALLLSGWH